MYRIYLILAFTCFGLWIIQAVAGATETENKSLNKEFADDKVIVLYEELESIGNIENVTDSIGAKVVKTYPHINACLVTIPEDMNVKECIEFLKKQSNIKDAEPDYIYHADLLPNDTDFDRLYGLHNIGQTGGVSDADIDASDAWDINSDCSKVVVAVIDTGVDYNHPDLSTNMWRNPGEIPGNLKDDDGNGYIDDIYGIDTVNKDSDPMDDRNHGTHVAGIIGAVGNNSTGVTGVCWNAQIMALKFLDRNGFGNGSDAIECINYMIDMKKTHNINVKVCNNSWSSSNYSSALRSAIFFAKEADILFVASAGNNGKDNDVLPVYPANYDVKNVVSVASTDHNDNLASDSNYGATTVDIAAPGVNIYSTTRDNTYNFLSGTSMAAPHVSGTAALLWSKDEKLTFNIIRNKILLLVDPLPALTGKVYTHGRLNLGKSTNCDNSILNVKILSPFDGSGIEPGEQNLIKVHVHSCGSSLWGSTVVASFNNGDPPLSLFDDGKHNDGVVDDGIYATNEWVIGNFVPTNINVTATRTGFVDGSSTISINILKSISIDPIEASIVKGLSLQYSAKGVFENGPDIDITNLVNWSSKDKSIATVDKSGLATGLSKGTTKIKSSLQGVKSMNSKLHILSEEGDEDDDGLTNKDEASLYNTDPLNNDSDEDGMDDGWEIEYMLNPLQDDTKLDLDGDGNTNLAEYNCWTYPNDIASSSSCGDIFVSGIVRLDTGDSVGAEDSSAPIVNNDSNGHVYVTWEDRRNGDEDIYFNYSNDYGKTWPSHDIRLNTGDSPGANLSLHQQMDSDDNGHVYVTWEDRRNGQHDIYFNYSSDYGKNWQLSDIKLEKGDSPSTFGSFLPQIRSDNHGHVYVVWYSSFNDEGDILFNYSSDYGKNWQLSDIRLGRGDSPGASRPRTPQISSDNNGHVYVAWVERPDGLEDIYFNYSNDYGKTWQANIMRLDTGDPPGANSSSSPQISSDDNGHVYVTWEDRRNGQHDIYFNYSSNYGATWHNKDIRLDIGDNPGKSDSEHVNINSDDKGHVYVAWADRRNKFPTDIYFNYASDFGLTWDTKDVRIDTGDKAGANHSFSPQVKSLNNGHVYVVWNDRRNGNGDVYLNYSNDYGKSWQLKDKRLDIMDSPGAHESFNPQMSISNKGHVYVVWADDINGNDDIYVNAFVSEFQNGRPESITITPVDLPIAKGSKIQFTAKAKHSNGNVTDLTNYVTWKSSNSNIIDIDPTGLGIALNIGTTEITASLNNLVSPVYNYNVIEEKFVIWVDFTYNGIEDGTEVQPFNTIAEAIDKVPDKGKIIIKSGTTDETLTIMKDVEIYSSGGKVKIGKPLE